MAAGHYVNGICVDTAVSTHVFFSQNLPTTIHFSNTTQIYKLFAYANGVWSLEEYNIASTGALTLNFRATLPTPALAPCTYDPSTTNTERFMDGNALGWGVALAMVAAWAIHAMRRGL